MIKIGLKKQLPGLLGVLNTTVSLKITHNGPIGAALKGDVMVRRLDAKNNVHRLFKSKLPCATTSDQGSINVKKANSHASTFLMEGLANGLFETVSNACSYNNRYADYSATASSSPIRTSVIGLAEFIANCMLGW